MKTVRQSIYALVAVVLLCCTVSLAHASELKKLLVVESYHSDYAWDESYLRGIRDTLGPSVTVDTFQLNTKRISPTQFRSMADQAFAYYLKTQPDAVILADDNAVKLLGKKIALTAVPLVFLGISGSPREYGVYGFKNVFGVMERPLIKRSIQLLTHVDSKVKHILLLFDDGTTAKTIYKEQLNSEFNLAFAGIFCDLKLISTYDQWQKEVLDAPKNGYDTVIVGLYHTLKGDDDKVVDENRVLDWTSQNTPLPIYALWDFAIGKGKTIGGFVLRGEDQGEAAAKLLLDFFAGRPAPNFPRSTAPRFAFSRHELKRWGITLPRIVDKQTKYKD